MPIYTNAILGLRRNRIHTSNLESIAEERFNIESISLEVEKTTSGLKKKKTTSKTLFLGDFQTLEVLFAWHL